MDGKILRKVFIFTVIFLAIALASVGCNIFKASPLKTPPAGFYIEPAGFSGGVKVEVSVDNYTWKKEGVLKLEVAVNNTSKRTLKKAELIYSLYDKDGAVIKKDKFLQRNNISYLDPDGTKTITIQEDGSIGLPSQIAKYEFTFRNIVWGEDITAYSVVDYPRDPQSPWEVAVWHFAAFADLLNDDFEKTQELLSVELQNKLIPQALWWESKQDWNNRFDYLTIEKESFYNDYAEVELVIYFQDGSIVRHKSTIVWEDGWKLGSSKLQ